MKTLLVFFSMGGRTKKVAQTIAAEFQAENIQIEQLISQKSRFDMMQSMDNKSTINIADYTFNKDILDLAKYDRILFGTPTYGAQPAPAFNAFIQNIIKSNGKEWILFATGRLMPGKIFEIMRKEIESKGGKVMNQHFFKGFFKINLNKAIEFGKEIQK